MAKILTGDLFLKMLSSGANNLANQHHEINALNVFPVPDGDTGTNMNLTFTSGLNASQQLVSSHLGEITKKLSRGLLMGARGNSGVILSQIFRGFSQSVEGLKEANVLDLAKAFQNSKEVAYKAVMRPVEGTILTVLRESSQVAYDWAVEHEDATILEYFDVLCEAAKISLDGTPELLPVLKEAGVVDSGGAGYLAVLEGFRAVCAGKAIDAQTQSEATYTSAGADMEHDEFGYCTEFIIQLDPSLKKYDENEFRQDLENLGNSLVVVTDEDLVKVHVHTLKPGNALNLGQRYGEFLKLKIENMSEQHHTIMESDTAHALKTQQKKHEKYAIVSVATGSGIVNLFKELRAQYIISGGQTMNPSTEDFVALIESINADHVFILPNNSNIILAANQAKALLEDRDVHVLETKTIPQGLSACIMFNPEVDVEENIAEMMDAVKNTRTAQVTYAIKDTVFENLEIKENDTMGILEGDIIVANADRKYVVESLLNELITEETEIVTVLAGEDVNDDEFKEVEDFINNTFDIEVECHRGEQPVYSFIFGAE